MGYKEDRLKREEKRSADSYKEIIERIESWKNNSPAGPIWLELAVTQKCNLNCSFCVRRNMSFQPEKELSTERIIEIIREAKDLGVKRFFLIGGYGEPMAKEGIMDIIREIKNNAEGIDYYESMITNGTLFNEETIKEIVKLGWKQIIISLDAPNANVHDELRGIPGTFNRVVKNINLFNKYKKEFNREYPELWITTVLCNKNYKLIPELVVFCAKNKITKLRVVPLMIKSKEGESLKLNKKELKELPKIIEKSQRLADAYNLLTDIDELKSEIFVKKTESMKELLFSDISNKKDFLNIPCYQPWHNISVRENGFLDVCLNLNDRGERVENKSLKEVWYGGKINKIRNDFLNHKLFKECKQCCIGLYRKSRDIREILRKRENRLGFRKENNKYYVRLSSEYFKSLEEIEDVLFRIETDINSQSRDKEKNNKKENNNTLLKDEIIIYEEKKTFQLARTVLEKKEPKVIIEVKEHDKKFFKDLVSKDNALFDFINKNKEIVGILDAEKTFAGPKVIEMHITNRCNNNCIGCWFRSPLYKGISPLLGTKKDNEIWRKLELPFKTIKRVIDDLAEIGTEEIQISGGGEPTLHPDFLKVIKYIKKKGIKLVFTTNFTLWDKSLVEEVLKVKPEQIVVSLWSGTPKTYAKIHPNKDEETFIRIRENLKYLTELRNKLYDDKKPGIEICQVILKYNYNELEEMIDFALDVRATAVRFSTLDATEPTKILLLDENEIKVVKDQLERIKKRLEEINKNGTVLELRGLDVFEASLESAKVKEGIYTEPLIKNIPCYEGWIRSEITTSGDILFCCKAGKAPIGNVLNKDFKNLWNSKEYQTFRINALKLSKENKFFKNVGCLKKCDNIIQDILPTLEFFQKASYKELLALHIGRWILKEKNRNKN
ncbi:MAG: radical SAM protein [Candidatus Woesearchaeota archaeon]